MTKDEHDIFLSEEREEGDEDLVDEESKDYHKAYINAMMDLQKKYNLRRRNVVVDPPKRTPEGQASASHPTTHLPREKLFSRSLRRKIFPKKVYLKTKIFQRKAYPKKNTSRRMK